MKKRLLSLFCALALCLGLLPSAAFAAGTDTGKSIQLADSETAANIGGGQADNIYFGNYFQSSSTTKEPVKWRVLSNSDGKLFLLSDQNLDVKPYNSSSTGITWEKSTIRSWLNGYAASENNSGTDYSSNNFIDAAFSSDEQVAIADTYVYNKNDPSYNTSGGEDTTDQIFLLSIEEANNSSYFPNGSNSRKSTNTAYVASYSGMLGAGEADYWWLRSPGKDDDDAAFVDDGGVVYNNGYIVVHTNTAVRPAFNLNLNSVLFTSAAAGGKSASGMDSGLTAVGGYDGNEWKLTLLDSSRNFSVTEETASGKPGDTITLNYTGASTGDNEYISVILADDSGAQYYGRIAKPTTADGQVKITIPASLADGTYTLNVFSEQYNGGENDDTKLTDYASAFEAVTLTVDTTAPTLSNGSATRDSETTATVKFTSDEAGEYYYTVVESGATEPTDIVSGDSANMASGENTITLTNLTAGTKDIYIVAKDAMGNVSQTLQIVIPEFIPTYTISASPAALNFSNKTVGYTEAPDAKTVTITNTGNQEVTVTLPTGTNYTITAGTGFADVTATLAPNGTATFAVQPKTGLAVGSYSEPLTISSKHNTSAEVSLAFTVDPKSLDGAQVQVSGSYIYDGNAKEPSGENVTVTLHGEPLTENTDYTLSYEDNTDAGEATVKATGKGNYTGTAEGTFTINKAEPTVSEVEVSSPATIYASTDISTITLTHGADDTPGTVKLDDGQTLSVGEDSYNWIFIPNDGNNYETTTGSIRLTVYEPPQEVDGVYQIDSVTDLFWFAGLVNGTLENVEQDTAASAVLTADIDLSGETWTPIGSESTPYTGTFDGQGYTISGMTIENAESYSGLFGNVTGTVKNFTVTGSITITGDETVAKVGGAVGSLGTASAGGTVSGVTSGVDITVSAGNDHIGGVVGSMPENSSPTVENCIYTGKITVTAAAGSVAGIVGYIRTGTIQNCANQGSISVDVGGTGSVGGILGYCNNGGIYIRNCYNTGAISADGTDNVGAIVGQNKGTQATVSNCYYLTGSANQGQGQLTTDAAGTVVKTADEFASGEVTYLLNGSSSDSPVWYQNLDNGQDKDTYPVLDGSHGIVYCIEEDPVRYSNDPDATAEPKDISDATVTLNQSSFTYNGQSQKPTVTVTLGDKTLTEDTDYTVSFSGDTTNVGEVTVTIKGTGNYTGEATNKPSYTINKATPTLTWSEGSQTLPYTGSPADITAPTVNLVNNETYSGTISYKYKTKEAGTYTEGLPIDAGTYTVMASIAAQGNYTAASGELTLTIKKAAASGTASAVDGLTYNGQAQNLVTAGAVTGGTMQYSTDGSNYSTTIPTGINVGEYSVWYYVKGDANHTDSEPVNITVTIAKAAAKVTKAPAANTLTYNGEAQALATAGEADGGTLVYSLEKDGDYDAAIPTGTNAGSYSIWYKVVGDANHSDTDPVQVEVTIKKADPDVTAPDGLTATYGDTLSDVALSGGWTWDTPDASVGNVGGNTFAATYMPSDTTNYNTVNEDLTVTVSAKGITGAEITLGDVLTYTGQQQTQQIDSVTVDGLTVTYTVTGNTATDAGDYTLTISGTGNFTGTATKGWSIAKKEYTGTTGVSGTVLANWPDKVTLPAIPDGASYGAASTTDDLTGLSIEGSVLHYTGGTSIAEGQKYEITVPVDGGKNYNDYEITITLTGTDKQVLNITGVTAQNGTYNGQAQTGYTGTPSAEGYGGGFTVTYNTADGEAPTNAGAYIVTIAIPEDNAQYVGSADLQFTIAPKALTVSAPSPSVYVGDSAPELALTYTGLVAGESVTPSEDPVFTITKADGTVIALEDAVKTAGTYTITWSNADQGFTGDENYDIQTETAGTLTVSTRSSGGGSSSNITTETTKNPDGSTTITVTNKVTGTVTETTKNPDGSKQVVETKKDGTVTTTTTDTAGNKTEVVENTDGSSQTTVTNKDGSGSVTVVDENGQVVSEATLSQSAVAAAQEKGEAVALPMPEVPVTTGRETAPTVTVDLPVGGSVKVEIPVAEVAPGTVAVLVKANGDEEIIKTSVTTEGGVAVTLSDGDTVKVVDNSKTFDDVADNYWGAEAVDFAVSRELFAGTSATTFAPDTAMTRAMIVTVLARFEGVDTTTGSTWYEAGQQWAMQNGISDGSNMEQGLTREQLATMLYRYAQSKGYDTTQGGMAIREYADFEQISDYAVEAMTWAVNTGLISGTSTTTLSPQGLATRAQVATILMRFIEGMA